MNNNFGFRAAVDNATLWTLKQKVLHNEKETPKPNTRQTNRTPVPFHTGNAAPGENIRERPVH